MAAPAAQLKSGARSGDALGIGVDEGTEGEDPQALVDRGVRGLLEGEIEVNVGNAEGIGSEGDHGRRFRHLVAPPAAKAVAGFDGGLGLSPAPLEECHRRPAQHEGY